MKIKHSITFGLFSYGKDRKHQVQMTITFGGDRLRLSTGRILPSASLWDAASGTVVPGPGMTKAEAGDVNADLSAQREAAEGVFRYYEALERTPTLAQYRDRLLLKTKGPKAARAKPKAEAAQEAAAPAAKPERPSRPARRAPDPSRPMRELFPLFESECGTRNAWTKATYEKMESLLRDIEAYRPGMRCGDLDEGALTGFVEYLRSAKVLHTPRRKKADRDRDGDAADDTVGLRNSSIAKKLGFLKWFLNWATETGYNTQTAYRRFRPTLKMTQKKVIYLTEEELRRVAAVDLAGVGADLGTVRDIFLFCCFTGLRYSDAQNLRWSDVGDGWVDVTTVKTADSVRIELNGVSSRIVEKYRGVPVPDGYVLPRFTNQAMNRDLKELCRLAGIDGKVRVTTYRGSERLDEVKEKWRLVGTHTGRRTFIVQALSRGISPNVVMKWTGHSDYSAMKPYIDIVDSIRASEMHKMDFLG